MLRRGPLRPPRLAARHARGQQARRTHAWARHVASPSNNLQAYLSSSDDPFVNLSIEHHLLQHAPPDSAVLFLYVNRPCVVIGRNQNPWLELNLSALRLRQAGSLPAVDFVRRRSGGGTVFHDRGNFNWTVISPSPAFTRDKHAEMVVRALRSNGVDRARVNERHDIVLDQGSRVGRTPLADLHRTPYTRDDGRGPRPLKVSGSAYKLTRGRALHHGTALLKSPNLAHMSQYLRSPARPYIKAKGVESVSSPITNIGLEMGDFRDSVLSEFARLYSTTKLPFFHIGEDALETKEVSDGVDELQTPSWAYGQTPQFTFLAPFDARTRTLRETPSTSGLQFELRHAHIETVGFVNAQTGSGDGTWTQKLRGRLEGRSLYDEWDWAEALSEDSSSTEARMTAGQTPTLASWMRAMFPTGTGGKVEP